MKAIIVENDSQQAAYLKEIVRGGCMQTVVCSTINEAWMQLKAPNSNFCVVLLDLHIDPPRPSLNNTVGYGNVTDGERLIQQIRGDRNTRNIPIIAITAERNIKTKLSSLKFGADYYFNKPVLADELIITIKNCIARFHGHSNSTINYGNITLNTLSREFLINGIPVPLTKKEYGFVESLALRFDQCVSKEVILTDLYGDRDKKIGGKVLDVFKFKVLHKMKQIVEDADSYIQVQWATGYKLTCPPSAYAKQSNNNKISINSDSTYTTDNSLSTIDVNFIKL